ncbi:hypothetical protein FPANT_2428 [Fusarium pseudoanthophilum]|uniref:CCHC-type domain-containing protein n=1 Tax=Fusarium pseudoanthophilum TaxID=48495 RepID=A0A8H5PQE1_9HYPO|nr:hypothetical protein FPANT_2428 [Fusarium pseudoanthophilum]
MSDNSAPEKQTTRERASGSGRGNIGPDRNRDQIMGTSTLSDRHGVQKSQSGHQISDEQRERRLKPDRVAYAKAKKLMYEILMSDNNARPRMPLWSRNLDRIISKKRNSDSKPCANCKGQGHQVAGCITTVHGFINACFFCEKDDHRTDDCDTFKQLSLAEKVKLLVAMRAGMPGLAPWWNLLYEFLEAKETKDIPFPTDFPWTAKFAIGVFEGKHGKPVGDIQTELDMTEDPKVLPVDTKLRSLADVWSYYWFYESRPSPNRAHIPRP